MLGRVAAPLARVGVHTVGDLLRYYPRRYLPMNELTDVAELPLNELVTMVGEVRQVSVRQMQSRRGQLMNVVLTDARGQPLHLAFFNRVNWHRTRLVEGARAVFRGKVSVYQGKRQLAQPSYEVLPAEADLATWRASTGLREVLPVYRESEKSGLRSEAVQAGVAMVLDTLTEADVPDPIPVEVRARQGLVGLHTALEQMHRPQDMAEQRAAQRRRRASTAWSTRSTPGCRSPSPTGRSRSAAGSPRTWPGRTRCTGCCRARSARARR